MQGYRPWFMENYDDCPIAHCGQAPGGKTLLHMRQSFARVRLAGFMESCLLRSDQPCARGPRPHPADWLGQPFPSAVFPESAGKFRGSLNGSRTAHCGHEPAQGRAVRPGCPSPLSNGRRGSCPAFRFMEREHLQAADVSCGHEPDRHGVGSSGFSRLHAAQPAKAGTPKQPRFTDRLGKLGQPSLLTSAPPVLKEPQIRQ